MSNWLSVLAPFLFSCLHCLAEICSITFYLGVENILVLSNKAQILLSVLHIFYSQKHPHIAQKQICPIETTFFPTF